jgi:hypothetical protein
MIKNGTAESKLIYRIRQFGGTIFPRERARKKGCVDRLQRERLLTCSIHPSEERDRPVASTDCRAPCIASSQVRTIAAYVPKSCSRHWTSSSISGGGSAQTFFRRLIASWHSASILSRLAPGVLASPMISVAFHTSYDPNSWLNPIETNLFRDFRLGNRMIWTGILKLPR